MAEHTKWSTLKAEVLLRVNDALDKEVATAVKEQISESFIDEVYLAGEPKKYERRNLHRGSLGDTNEMNHTVEGNILTVMDDADYNNEFAASPKSWGYGEVNMKYSLAYSIEKGYGDKDEWYNEPRPFMKEAQRSLVINKKHVIAMKKGLTRNGLKVE